VAGVGVGVGVGGTGVPVGVGLAVGVGVGGTGVAVGVGVGVVINIAVGVITILSAGIKMVFGLVLMLSCRNDTSSDQASNTYPGSRNASTLTTVPAV
jgi:hypothetical protein